MEVADRLSGIDVLLTLNSRTIDETFEDVMRPTQKAYTQVQQGFSKLEKVLGESRIQRGRVSLFRTKGSTAVKEAMTD